MSQAIVDSKSFLYQIAGLSVEYAFSKPLAPSLSDISVVFSSTVPAEIFEADEFCFVDPMIGLIKMAKGGGNIYIPQRPRNGQEAHALIRRVLPFSAALKGLIILHGASIVFKKSASLLIGESGVGKSTFSKALARSGAEVAADDLSRVSIDSKSQQTPRLETGEGSFPIDSVYFLEARTKNAEAEVHSLKEKEALQLYVRHGFGECAHAEIWSRQFLAYGELARSVPSYSIALPDDLKLLPRIAEQFLLERN